MAVRFYLMPIVRTTNPVSGSVTRSPKYFFEGVNYQGMDYGLRDVYLFAADVTSAQHSSIAANADVSAFPANLDNTLGANRQAVEDALEGHNLPGAWVTTGMAYRTVLRVVVGSCLIAQRYAGLARAQGADPDLFPAGVTLGTAYADMPTEYRARLLEAVDSLGYDRSMLTNQSTMRDLLRVVGQQAQPVTFLGVQV